MAEIDTSGKGGKGKTKKVSTKVDMTAMVDLAFLLITFFMLTTSFNKPQTMEVNMPDKTEDNKTVKVRASQTFTFILDKDDKIHYWQGTEGTTPEVKTTDYSDQGIRKVLLEKKALVKNTTGKDIIVIIKAKDNANYKNIVDMLDEMAITGITIYALVDITPADLDFLTKQGITS